MGKVDMNSIQKTPEQRIDEAVESLKALFLSQAKNQQKVDEISRRLDSLVLKSITRFTTKFRPSDVDILRMLRC